jgi:hypothetical protein
MRHSSTFRRLAARRASRRRIAELSPPEGQPDLALPLPPLVSPDEDREFAQATPARGGLRYDPACCPPSPASS